MSERALLVLLAVAWLATLLLAPLAGSHDLDLADALTGDGREAVILWQLRLPRVLLALIAGGVLAMTGVGFQSLFQNPLAEPYTLGVAGGAALGAVIAIGLGSGGLLSVAAAAFVGALAAISVVVGLALRRGGTDTPTLLLAGVSVQLTCAAAILLLQFLADPSKTFRIVRWMMGGLAVLGFREVLWLAPWAVISLLVLLAVHRDLDVLLTGEELAASRGVDLARLRLGLLGASSLAVGALVAVAGPIGFVGLIVPHFLRRMAGHRHRMLVPAALLGGGVFLAGADLLARTVLAPAELPVGVLTALAGGPFFLWLLLSKRG